MLVKRLAPDAIVPTRGSKYAAGWDLYALHGMKIGPQQTATVRTGIALAIPEGYAGLVLPRSGLATKKGLRPANTPGLIDSDYRGEVLVVLHNDSYDPKYLNSRGTQEIRAGERIAQLVIIQVPHITIMETALDLPETERGEGGFGSTGD